MLPKRLSIKFFTAAEIPLEKVVPVFQRWIQRQTVEGLLIDVADYQHVQAGPGVILIGDEGDYAIDLNGNRPGMLYLRKRQMPGTLQEALQLAFRLNVAASLALQAESTLGKPEMDFSTAHITFLDRLNTPNKKETFEAIKAEITAFAAALYSGENAVVALVQSDPREPLTIQISTPGPVDAATLLERLNSNAIMTN